MPVVFPNLKRQGIVVERLQMRPLFEAMWNFEVRNSGKGLDVVADVVLKEPRSILREGCPAPPATPKTPL